MNNDEIMLSYKKFYDQNNTLPPVIENIEVIYPEALHEAVIQKYDMASDQLDPIDYLHFQNSFLETEINWLENRLPSVKRKWKSKNPNYYTHVCHTYNGILTFFKEQINDVQDELHDHGERVRKSSVNDSRGILESEDVEKFIWSGKSGLGQLYEKLHDKYINATLKDFMAVFGIGEPYKKVIWDGEHTLFAFFLDQLEPFIQNAQYNRRFSIASKLFLDNDQKPFNNLKLAKLSNNYQNNKTEEPKDAKAIKEIFENIKF